MNINNKIIGNRFVFFIICGIINTGTTYLIYLLLLIYFHYQIAYLTSYISGIILSYFLNLFIVFKEKSTFRKFLQYPFIYLIQYVIGTVLLYFFVKFVHFPEEIAPLTVSIALIPVTYMMNKIILVKKDIKSTKLFISIFFYSAFFHFILTYIHRPIIHIISS